MKAEDFLTTNKESYYNELIRIDLEQKKQIRRLLIKIQELKKNALYGTVYQARKILTDFSAHVNKNELSESSEKITDYSVKSFIKNKLQ